MTQYSLLEPTVCPQLPTTQLPQQTSSSESGPGGAISGGAIAGITVSTILIAMLLCVILTTVCFIATYAKKSRIRTKRQKKTYGKARFIRSLYILPKHYKPNKDNNTYKSTSTDVSMTAASDLASTRKEAVVVVDRAEKGMEEMKKKEVEQVSNNDSSYVNLKKISETPDHTNMNEDYYEDNPYARGYFQGDKTEVEKKDYENAEVYLNQEFKRPSSLPTHNSETNNKENDLYVNTFLAREDLAEDSPMYVNQRVLASLSPNKVCGMTDRSQQQLVEDEYVYVETNRDGPEDEYEDMAYFGAQT